MSGIRFGRSGNGYDSTQVMLSAADDWRDVHDSHERRKIQNRLAQRNYRRKLRARMSELEAKANATSSVLTDVPQLHTPPSTVRGSPAPRRASGGSRYKTNNISKRGPTRRASAPQTTTLGMMPPHVTITAPFSPPMSCQQDAEIWSPATATPVTPLDHYRQAQWPASMAETLFPSTRLAIARTEPRFIPAEQYNPDLDYQREQYSSPTMGSPGMWAQIPVVKTEEVDIPVTTAGLVGLGMCCAPDTIGAYTATSGWVQGMGQQQGQEWGYDQAWEEGMEQMNLGSPQGQHYWGA